MRMTDRFVEAATASGFHIVTPRDPDRRGSQICVTYPNEADLMRRRLIARSVIGDFRPPDVLRFCIIPLTLRFAEPWRYG